MNARRVARYKNKFVGKDAFYSNVKVNRKTY